LALGNCTMPRPRIVHRSSRVAGERHVVPTPLEPATPVAPETDPGDGPASPPRLAAVTGGGVLHQVQMENVHPLRLRLLLEIDRTGSISAAAERCAIGQPSASMHLRTLEAAIGQRLVIRNGRGSRLTAPGKIVASHAARMLATLESMRCALGALNAPSWGELTLAASHTPSVALIPPILRDFSERYPGVSVNVRTLPSEAVVREVGRGAVDIGIAGEVACPESVVRQQILIDELVGVAPVGLLRSNGGPVNRGEFARHSLLLGPEGSSTRMVTERHLARADYRPAQIWEFDSFEAIKRAVADGIGVSFISQGLVGGEIERAELVPFRISGVGRMLRPIYAVQPTLAELPPHAAGFMALLSEANRPSSQTERLSREGQPAPEPGWDRSSPAIAPEPGWDRSSPTM
jgi:LysR family transcriptional regulator, low CO2-responsive transcriptional regulator